MAVSKMVTTSLTVTGAAGGVQVVPASNARVSLMIQNTGTGSASFGFDVAPTAGSGVSLDAASGAGGQGGSRIWDHGDSIPSNAIFVFSAAGTTIVVVEGFAGP